MPSVARMLTELPPRPAIPSAWNAPEDENLWLHLGECPYPPLPSVCAAIRDAAANLHHYPDTSCSRVRKKVAGSLGKGIGPDQILCGNGSDDLIDLIALTYAGSGGRIVSFEPTFFVYRACARRHGAHYASIPRDAAHDFAFPDTDQLARGMAGHRPQVIFLANPNNPTGTLTEHERIEALLQGTQGGPLVVVDECYFAYSRETALELIERFPHLVILRSLSKSGSLAGLRFGYAVGAPDIVRQLEQAALTFPVNALAQAAACAVLDEHEAVAAQARAIVEERERLADRLRKLGLEVASSAANLLLISSGKSARLPEDAAARLAGKKIHVSDQSKNVDLGKIFLRIGIGANEHSDRLIEALEEILT